MKTTNKLKLQHSTTTQSANSMLVFTVQKNKKSSLIDVLNQVLASTLDLKLQAKQAHWNLKGPNFISVHELFDKVASEVDEHADTLAERVMQLGGQAQGTSQAIVRTSILPVYPTNLIKAADHLAAIANAIGIVSKLNCDLVEAADSVNDVVTADIGTGIARGLDKLHWFVRSHLQG